MSSPLASAVRAPANAEGLELNDKVQDIIAAMVDSGTEGAKAADAAATSDTARLVILTLLGAALLLGVGIALLISRSVTGPVAKVLHTLREMSGGDLRVRVDYRGRDEIAEISTAVNELAATTAGAMKATGDSANELRCQRSAQGHRGPARAERRGILPGGRVGVGPGREVLGHSLDVAL